MAKKLCNDHGTGPLPLGNKAGNVQSTFKTGIALDRATSTGWAGDRDKSAGNSRRASGGNKANSGPDKSRGSLSFSNKDGQRQAGVPSKSGKSRGPSGVRSKKGRLK